MFLVIIDVPVIHLAEVWDIKTLRTNVPNHLSHPVRISGWKGAVCSPIYGCDGVIPGDNLS